MHFRVGRIVSHALSRRLNAVSGDALISGRRDKSAAANWLVVHDLPIAAIQSLVFTNVPLPYGPSVRLRLTPLMLKCTVPGMSDDLHS